MTRWTTTTDIPDFGEARRDGIGFDTIEVEDGGQALIYHVELQDGSETGFFVQLRSWGNAKERIADSDKAKLAALHPDFAQFAGKRVRVTVETIDG